jgi:ABC-2 type transport system permease protein
VNRLVAAEWVKLTTTRLLWVVLPLSVALSAAAVAGATLSADSAGVALASTAGVRRSLHVAGTGAILVLVLGIMLSAGEYRTRTATDTFLTTPRRNRVLAAKLIVGGLLGAAVGVLTAAVCLVVVLLLYRQQGATVPLGSADVWLTLAGAVLYAALFAVLGVALGSLLRSQVAAVVGALAWLLVVEQVLVSLAADAGRWLPGAAGQAIVRSPAEGLLSPAGGTALLLAYATAVALAGVTVAGRRDA